MYPKWPLQFSTMTRNWWCVGSHQNPRGWAQGWRRGPGTPRLAAISSTSNPLLEDFIHSCTTTDWLCIRESLVRKKLAAVELGVSHFQSNYYRRENNFAVRSTCFFDNHHAAPQKWQQEWQGSQKSQNCHHNQQNHTTWERVRSKSLAIHYLYSGK